MRSRAGRGDHQVRPPLEGGAGQASVGGLLGGQLKLGLRNFWARFRYI